MEPSPPTDIADEAPPSSIEAAGFVPLDPRLLRLRTMLVVTVGLVLGLGAVVLMVLVDVIVGVAALVAVVVLGAAQLFAVRTSFRFWGYQIRDADLTVRHGVLHRSVTSVSFNRVQHASLENGPIERAVGLATISVFTAGGIGALRIEGLPNEVAVELQERILRRVAVTGRSTATPPEAATPPEPASPTPP